MTHTNWAADVGSLVRSLQELAKQKDADELAREAQERGEADDKARVEADEKARVEAEDKARFEAEEKARRRAEDQARRQEQARRQADDQARVEADKQARLRADERARVEADKRARIKAEEQAWRRADESGRHDGKKVAAKVLTAVTAVVVLALVTFALVRTNDDGGGDDGGGDGSQVVTKTVRVEGNRVWTDTGIDLSDGDTLEITATGSVLHSPDPNSAVGPGGAVRDGVNPGLNTVGEGVYTYPPGHGGLVGRLGHGGEVIGVGNEWRGNVTGDGPLQLGINDYNSGNVDEAVANNSGAFLVDITVTRNS